VRASSASFAECLGGAAGACSASAQHAGRGGFGSIPTRTAGRMQVAERRASHARAAQHGAPPSQRRRSSRVARRPARSAAPRGAQAMSMGVHESQSLLWERMVALGRPFARYLAPKLAAAFPQLPPELTPDSLYGGRARPCMKLASACHAQAGLCTFACCMAFFLSSKRFGQTADGQPPTACGDAHRAPPPASQPARRGGCSCCPAPAAAAPPAARRRRQQGQGAQHDPRGGRRGHVPAAHHPAVRSASAPAAALSAPEC